MTATPIIAAVFVLFVGTALIAAQAWFAAQDGWLTPKQMLRHHSAGLPFTAHLGMWSDIPLTLLLAAIVGFYGSYWTLGEMFRTFLVAVNISAFMHYTYTIGSFPEAHVRDRQLTRVGWVHSIYMVGALTILANFYFPSHIRYEGINEKLLVMVASVFLCLHVFCATHIPLSLFNLSWFPEKPLKNPMTWITVATVCGFLVWRTYVLVW